MTSNRLLHIDEPRADGPSPNGVFRSARHVTVYQRWTRPGYR